MASAGDRVPTPVTRPPRNASGSTPPVAHEIDVVLPRRAVQLNGHWHRDGHVGLSTVASAVLPNITTAPGSARAHSIIKRAGPKGRLLNPCPTAVRAGRTASKPGPGSAMPPRWATGRWLAGRWATERWLAGRRAPRRRATRPGPVAPTGWTGWRRRRGRPDSARAQPLSRGAPARSGARRSRRWSGADAPPAPRSSAALPAPPPPSVPIPRLAAN